MIRALEQCEDRTLLATAFAVTPTNDLIRFDTAAPNTIVSSRPITGLPGGETIVGLDFRPATGQLYALGSSSRLYTIDYSSGLGGVADSFVTFDSLVPNNVDNHGYTEGDYWLAPEVVPPGHFHPRLNPINGTTGAVIGTDGDPSRFQSVRGAPFDLVSLDVFGITGETTFITSSGATQVVTAPGRVTFGPGFQNITFVRIDVTAPPVGVAGIGVDTIHVRSNATAFATEVGTGSFGTLLNGNEFGFDFNPVADRLRVVSDLDQNLRLDPNSGGVAGVDTPLAYHTDTDGPGPDTDDPNAGADPNVVASAYTNSSSSATTTTLYGIDTHLDVLVRQGGADVPPGTPSPNSGQLFTVGSLGVDASDVASFDIRGATNTAYAALVVGGTSSLYQVDLTTGAATLIGPIGGSAPVRGLAIAPEGFANTTLVGDTATFNGTDASERITFDAAEDPTSGTPDDYLRHNRFALGDPGFASDFDFDPATPGVQRLLDAASSTVIVNSGGGDDQVVIGSALASTSSLLATIQVNGGAGNDTLTLDDTANANGRTITLANASVAGLFAPVAFGTLETLSLYAGSGADTINVQGTTARTNINAGGGNDTIAFADGATLSGGIADGGLGVNTLNYSAYTTGVAVNLARSEFPTRIVASLNGLQEPNGASNSNAAGTGIFTLSPDQTELAFTVTYTELDGAISGAHFHNAPLGVNGPIVRGLLPSEQNGLTPISGSFSGVWRSTDPTVDPQASDAPIRPLTPQLVSQLLANRIYFNIHTVPNFPGGEIRGQLIVLGFTGMATGTGGVRGFDNVIGGSGDDVLTGNGNANVFQSGAGNDTLSGGLGNDMLVGGPGNDRISGEDGDDTIVWNNGDGSDVMDGGAGNDAVVVNGAPAAGTSPAGDDFLLTAAPDNRISFQRTNLGPFTLDIGTVEKLNVNGQGGDDTQTIDFGSGNPIPSGGIAFDGGADTDRLVLQGAPPAGSFAFETYVPTGPGAGTITLDGSVINFASLAQGDDTVPATNFTFTAPADSAVIDVVDGPVVSGFSTAQINSPGNAFELTNFANKTNVAINSGGGAQAVVLNNPTAPAGLASLTINTAGATDQVVITAAPAGAVTAVNTQGENDAVLLSGAGLPSGATIRLDGGAGFDTLTYDAGGVAVTLTPGPLPNQTTITRPGSGSVVYQNYEQIYLSNVGAPPTAVITPALAFAAVEGRPLVDVAVTQFTADPTASSDRYEVSINWGDGTLPSAGTVVRDVTNPGRFTVTGSHTYESPGTFPVEVTVSDRGRTLSTVINSVPVVLVNTPVTPITTMAATVTAADAPLDVHGATVAVGRQAPTGTVLVATFLDTGGVEAASTYTARISWGDGETTDGSVTVAPPGSALGVGTMFQVLGSHIYRDAGVYPIVVTIASLTGSTAVAAGQAVVSDVSDGPITLTGRLDPSSDTGISNTDGLTNDTTPTFLGTSRPGSIVRLFGQVPGQAGPTPLGQAVTAAGGAWEITSIVLPDGVIAIMATVDDASGAPVSPTSLGTVTIDTVGPQVTGMQVNRAGGRLHIRFRDDRGMDGGSLIDKSNIAFVPVNARRGRFLITSLAALPQSGPTSEVVATINGGQRLRVRAARLVVRSGGVRDAAGNALDGKFLGQFPSGNGQRWGDFVAALNLRRNRIVSLAAVGQRATALQPLGGPDAPV